MQKNIQKQLLMITLTILITLTIIGAVSAATNNTNTSLTVNSSSTYVNEPVNLTARLTMDSGSNPPLVGQTITFRADGSIIGTGITDNNGYASYIYTPTSQNQNVNLRAEFAGDNQYASSNGTGTLTVNRIPTTTTVTSPSGYNGDTVNIVATLTDNIHGNAGIASKTIYFNVNGVVYTAGTDANGVATLSYTIGLSPGSYSISVNNAQDVYYESSTGTGTLTVISMNHPPTANNYNVTVPEDGLLSGHLVGTDSDGDTLTYSLGTAPLHGTAVVNPNGTATYTPFANYNGPDFFTYIVSDGKGGSATGTVTITVTPVNDPPVAQNDTVNTDEDTPIIINVLGNDSDIDDGDTLTVTGVTQPLNGAVTLIGGVITYTPKANWFGSETFTYTISDGIETATATVYVNVISVNDVPVAVNETATTKEDTPVSGSLSGTDIDGDSLTFAQGTGPSNGTVIVNADGTYTYTPNANYYGSDSFTFIVNDGTGGTDEGTVNITVERAVASIYVLTTVSKNNPTVGETITITFKLGNKGPDPADDVVFTYVIPEGMEFVSLETEPGYPAAVYDPATRTITWTPGTVPVLDPWLKVNVKVLKAGTFNINPTVTTTTYDPTLGDSIQNATINAVAVVNAASNTVGMQETGLPVAGLILAILAVLGGFITTRK